VRATPTMLLVYGKGVVTKVFKTRGRGALLLALLVLIPVQLPKSAAATQKQVEFNIARRDWPVAITGVLLGGARVQAGRFRTEQPAPITPFDAGDDWIRNLNISLLNRTNKTIIYMIVRFSFPETAVGRTQLRWDLRLG